MDPIEWFSSLEPITRTWLGLSAAITTAEYLDLIPLDRLTFHPSDIYENLELWRIVTCFCYCGSIDINGLGVLLLLYLMLLHTRQYEQNPFPAGSGNRTADCAFCFLFCTSGLLLTFTLTYFLAYYYPSKWVIQIYLNLQGFFGRNLIFSILYLWSRRNPNAMIQLNFIPIRGQYLPFAHIALSYFLNDNRIPYDSLHGIFIGHIFYYCVHVLPIILGRPVLTTPHFLTSMFVEGHGDDDIQIIDGQPQEHDNHNLQHPRQPQHRRRNNNDAGATAAHLAAKLGRLREIQQLSSDLCRAQDANGWQPLHEAVRGGHLDVVNYLIREHQVDINARTNQNRGPSPLWLAESTHGLQHSVTERLVELGAVKIGPSHA